MKVLDVATFGETMVQLNVKTIGPLQEVKEWERHAANAESNFSVGIVKMSLSVGWIWRIYSQSYKGLWCGRFQVKFDASPPTVFTLYNIPGKEKAKVI